MKIIFFGLGSIGCRHAKILAQNKDVQLYAWRSRKSDYPSSNAPQAQELFSWQDVERVRPDAAFITNPTAMHIPTAIECARRGMALFLEKPLGATEQGLDELLSIVSKNKIVTYVAYLMRFSPMILKLKEVIENEKLFHLQVQACSYLPSWRPGRDHKRSYSSNKDMGGGVIFDLSHEIDYVHFMTGGVKDISGVSGRLSDITIDSEDFADIHLKTLKADACVHLSFFSHMNQRKIKADFSSQTIMVDLLNGTWECFKENKMVEAIRFDINSDELYVKQINYFLAHIHQTQMMNNIHDAAGLFRKMCAYNSSKQSRR